MKKFRENLKQLSSFETTIAYFFIYSFAGWLLETFYAFLIFNTFVKRGFLFIPLCPIYGFGAVGIMKIIYKYKKKPVKVFLYSAILFSVFEYVVSFILEALFSNHWWNYTDSFLNLNGRISISYAFIWGVISLIFIHLIHPFIKKQFKKIKSKLKLPVQHLIVNALIIILVIDTTISCIKYFNIKIPII